MKRGLIILLILVLVFSIGCDRIQVLSKESKYSQFAKLVNVLHLQEEAGVNLPFNAPLPFVEGSSGEQWIGNFFLTADVYGSIQKLLVKDDQGLQHQVEVYKLEKLKMIIKPKPLYGVQITHDDVTAGAVASNTRARLIDVNFAKYNMNGDTLIHEEYPEDADTKTGNTVTKLISFTDLYVPPNFKITMRFDVGEAGSQDEVRTPAILGAYVPAIVEWKPFPNAAGGEDPSLGEYEGKVIGYVNDAYTNQPIRYTEMVMDGHPSAYFDTTKTDNVGHFEFVVPLETNEEKTKIYPQHYGLNLETCKQNCKYPGINDVKDLFRVKHGITNFDYKGGLHYPLPEEPNLWIEVDNRFYFKPVWVEDKVDSRQLNHHDFYVQPAPPGAYLKTNKELKSMPIINTNEAIEFEGFGVDGVSEVTKWVIDFGDGNQVSGTGNHAKQEHKYAEPGNYTAGIKFGTYYDFWSPAYTQLVHVKKTSITACLDVIPMYLWLNKDANGDFIPGTVTIKGWASVLEGSRAVAWMLEPYNLTGQGDKFEIKKTFDKPGNYSIVAKFKDDHGQWGYGTSDTVRVEYKLLKNITPEEKYGVRTVPSEGFTTIKNIKVQFSGLAENVGYRPYGGNLNVVLKYKWDFNGDGIFDYSSNTPNEKIEYTYPNPGVYNAKFEVEDPAGYKESKIITVKVINVYATFDIRPSNVIKDGTMIDAWYTLHNKHNEDILVKSDVLFWEHKVGNSFQFSHYEPVQPYTGIVRAGESKEMWRERETVCCPGTRRGVAVIGTEYGELRTSLTKTILPVAQNQTPGSIVTISSARNLYDNVEPITIGLASNLPNAPCDIRHSLNSGPWIVAGTSNTDNNGAVTFTRANNPAGAYQVKAVCNNVESNVLAITVAVPAPQFNINFRMNKYSFSHEKLLEGRDAIIYVIEGNMPNTLCDIYAKFVVGVNRKIATITTRSNGDGVLKIGGPGLSVNIPAGEWIAYGICNNVESNKVRYTVTTDSPSPPMPTKSSDSEKEELVKTVGEGITSVSETKYLPVGIKKLTARTITELDNKDIRRSAVFLTILIMLFIICSRLEKKK